jgi:predicted dithiol-disulfide oxidoreductase (DUF899 family)
LLFLGLHIVSWLRTKNGWVGILSGSPFIIQISIDFNVSFTQEELDNNYKVFYNYIAIPNTLGAEEDWEFLGVSIFFKDSGGRVFHTYSAYARDIDMLNVAYHYLDLVPKGRDEVGQNFPQFWVRRHDEYNS